MPRLREIISKESKVLIAECHLCGGEQLVVFDTSSLRDRGLPYSSHSETHKKKSSSSSESSSSRFLCKHRKKPKHLINMQPSFHTPISSL